MSQEEDRIVRIGALKLRFLVDEADSGGKLVAFEFVVPVGAKVPAPHFHTDVDEMVYGLAGTITTTLDSVRHDVRPGQSLFIPRGSIHTHENVYEEPARSLIVMTPGSIGITYFQEVAREVNVPGRPDVEKINEIMLRFGLVAA